MTFRLWLESSFADLHSSAVAAFPNTKKRQHATDTVRITRLQWTPYVGTKSLLVRGLAQNFAGGGGEYRPFITFKGVRYHESPSAETVSLVADNGRTYFLSPLSRQDSGVLVRCGCADFFWRFNYFDHLDRSLFGRVRPPYQGQGGAPANPEEAPGVCKHLMKMFRAMEDAGVVF